MKANIKRVAVGILTIILIIVMLIFVDINRIVDNLSKISIPGIFLFILIYTGVFIIRSYRLQLLFKGLNLNTSFLALFGSFGIGWGINELTPGKIGDIIRIEVINEKNKNVGLSKSICGVAIERVIDLIILFSITCLVLLFMNLINVQDSIIENLQFI